MTLVGDSLVELHGAGGIVISIVDGNWHAATLPVAIVFVLCAGTFLLVTKRTGAGVVEDLVYTRSRKASTCIWAIHNVFTRAVRSSIHRDGLRFKTKFAITSVVIEMIARWYGIVPTHAVRSAEIPNAVVTVVTLDWK